MGGGSSAFAFEPRTFPLGCPGLKDERRSSLAMGYRKQKLHNIRGYVRRGEGMARADSGQGRRARPGERKPPLPKKLRALPAPRHLGASSPSGNARGGCRGCTPLVWTLCGLMTEGTIILLVFARKKFAQSV